MSGHAISYKITLLIGAYFNLVVPNNRTFLCLNQLEEKGAKKYRQRNQRKSQACSFIIRVIVERIMGMTDIKLRSPMREAVKL